MKQLLRSTTAYRTIARDAADGACAHFTLVLFPDAALLRALLKECAKAFFAAGDGSRREKLIEAEAYADCLFVPRAGAKFSAEAAAAIADESQLQPVEGNKKLFVLDAFHAVTPLVQNKLLKLLEEPPPGVSFLAGATAEHAVLPTVLSRANKIAEPPFSEEAVRAALERNHPGCAAAAAAAAACGGVYSAAETLLEGGGEDFRLAERFLAGDDVERLCREVGEQKRPSFFAAVRLLLRDILLERTGQGRYTALDARTVRSLAQRYPAGAALAALGLVDRAEREIQFNANFAQAALTLAIGIAKERETWQKLSS